MKCTMKMFAATVLSLLVTLPATSALAGSHGGGSKGGGSFKSGGMARSISSGNSFKSMPINRSLSSVPKTTLKLNTVGKLNGNATSSVNSNYGQLGRSPRTAGTLNTLKFKDKLTGVTTRDPISNSGALKFKDKIGNVVKKDTISSAGALKFKDKIGGVFNQPGGKPIDPGKGNGNGNGKGNCGPNGNKYCGGWPFFYPYPWWSTCGWGGCYTGYGNGYCGGYYNTVPIYTPVTSSVTQTVYETPVQQPTATPVVQTAATSVAVDLELLEVRQLDRGTAESGPAFRVTLRNKSGEAVTGSFHVALAATLGRQPSKDGAFVAEVVPGIEAGRPVSIDVRLPAKALNLGQNAEGHPVPFSWLTAVVDSHQELEQVTRENDFATFNRAEIAMVAAQ